MMECAYNQTIHKWLAHTYIGLTMQDYTLQQMNLYYYFLLVHNEEFHCQITYAMTMKDTFPTIIPTAIRNTCA